MPRMRKILLAATILFAGTGTASAGGLPGSIGVGAEFQLSGVGGLSVNYDTGAFHVGGFLGFDDPAGENDTEFAIGGRFFYHVASTASSDFGVGGGIGILTQDAVPERLVDVFIEPSFQIRAFLVPNVAMSFTGGFVIGTVDADGVAITGDVFGVAGLHYYF
jgi:hypothetical protein